MRRKKREEPQRTKNKRGVASIKRSKPRRRKEERRNSHEKKEQKQVKKAGTKKEKETRQAICVVLGDFLIHKQVVAVKATVWY